jgi:4-amino-4-deoxy-L-arabinose transferase-like glycosyltransferase
VGFPTDRAARARVADEPPAPAPDQGTLAARGPWLVLFAASITMLSRLWEGDIFRDEVLYAAVAKGILTSGEWLDLHLGDTPYWNKPPLMFWLVAALYRVLGVSVFSAKLIPAVFGVLCCLVLYQLARRLVGERVALVAALVLATTPRFVRTSATFRLDSGVTLFTLLSLLAYVRGADARGRGFGLAGLAWGLGVMAKGVFGLTGPYLFLIYLAVQRRLGLLFTWRFAASVLIGAAVSLPWHVYQVAHWGEPFLDVYLQRQVVDRMAGRLWHGPAVSYLAILMKDDWPWVAFLAIGTVVAFGAARRGDRGLLYLLCWAGGFLLLLYASQGRRARYLHQFYPPAAILSAVGLRRVLPAAWWERVPRVAAAGFAAAGFALLVLPIPVHSSGAAHLKALGPALDALAPGDRSPLPAFEVTSPNVRAAFVFYLDRDLRPLGTAKLPTGPEALVLADAEHASRLEARGYRRAYANPEYVLLRGPAG